MKQEIDYKKTRPVLFKSFAIADDFKVSKDARTVSGYLASFGNVDSDGDVLLKGCFAKSLTERGPESKTYRKIAYLYQHDITRPLGRFVKLQEDDRGLYFEAEMDEIQLAEETLNQYLSGTLNQHSIGYRYVWDKCEMEEVDGQMVLVCKEIQLFEGSVVTMGANENTPFTGMKGMDYQGIYETLLKEFDLRMAPLDAVKKYEINAIVSKMIALAEAKPVIPLPIQEPMIDFGKLLQVHNTQKERK